MDLSRVSRLELLLTKQLRIIRERDGGVRCVVYGYYPVHTANYSISFRNPIHQLFLCARESAIPVPRATGSISYTRAACPCQADSAQLIPSSRDGTPSRTAALIPACTPTRPPRIIRSCSSCPLIFPIQRGTIHGGPSTGPHPRGGRGNGTAAAHFIAPPRMAALRERCEPIKSLSIAVTAIPQQRQGSKLRKSLSATVADPRYACRARPRSRRYPRPPSPS